MVEHSNTRRARRLRQRANAPEQKAWQALRTLRAQGFAVRRQHPIGPYTVDFAIRKQKLVIEIDGSIHDLDEVKARDALRDETLTHMGWRVIRIPATVAMSADALLARMQDALGI